MSTKQKVHAASAEFIAPLESNSRVGFTIVTNSRGQLIGDVILSDCDRQIVWHLYHRENYRAVEKLNNAIRMLTAARDEWLRASKGRRKRK